MNTIYLAFSLRNTSVTEYFLELSNILSLNYNIVIIADSIEDHPFYISDSIDILQWPSYKPKNYKDFFFLFRMVQKDKPIMMISNFSSVSFFLVVGYFLGVKNRIAWCHSISGAFNAKPVVLFRKRLVYKLATRIFANSHATKQDLSENFNVKIKKIKVFYNAVKEPGLPMRASDENKILFVGGMSPNKGLSVLLEAMPKVLAHYPQIHLNIIGGNLKGREIKEFKEKTDFLNISENVTFLGGQRKEKVLEEFSRSYLTVVPSFLEAFGYVVVESFSVKTPVIGSNTTGIAEIIRDGVDGFLFEPGNHHHLSTQIVKLISNRTLRSEFSGNCYKRFKNNFEIRGVVKEISEYFDKCILG